jgi:hypothetical protein
MSEEATEARNQAQRTALRVQVAAIAAQQAALLEEESRLHERQHALTQQQEQLAAHLEEKRKRNLELAEQVKAAQAALKSERQDQARAAVEQTAAAASERADLDGRRQHLKNDRQRIKLLRRKLKRHFHNVLEAERADIRKRENAVADQHRQIEEDAKKLHQERSALARERLSQSGDIELGKRQLQAGWNELQQQQVQLKQEHDRQLTSLAMRAQVLRQRENSLADAERVLANQKKDWELSRKVAEQEAQGLENRIVNLRRRLLTMNNTPAVARPPAPETTSRTSHQTQSTVNYTDDLADQRLELVEYWQRLALTQRQWEQECDEAMAMLESLAGTLSRREQAVLQREEALAPAEADLRQRQAELAQVRQHLEGWAARAQLREMAWTGERDRLVADLKSCEEAAEKRLQAVANLRQTWAERQLQEVASLRGERAACEELGQELAGLRQEYWKRILVQEQERRELSEKMLTLKEYQQRLVVHSQDPAAVERRLERLRNHWVRGNSTLMRQTKLEFERLQAEAAHMQERGRQLLTIAENLGAREANLAQRQTAWEEAVAKGEARQITLQQLLQNAQTQREIANREIAELRGEVERLAKILLDEAKEPTHRRGAAA